MHTAVGRYKGYVHVVVSPLSIDMICNASVYRNQVNAHDLELALYVKGENLGSSAVLAGAHEANRIRRMAARRSVGPARRAGMWVSHHLAALMVLGG